MLRPGQGTFKERLDRCREAAKRHAETKRHHLDADIREFQALSENRFSELSDRNYEQLFCDALGGKGSAQRLHAIEEHIRNLDGDVFVAERAPEVLASVFWLYWRVGLSSPDVAEQLGLTAPQVRQILFRANRVARKEENQTVTRRQYARRRHLNREKAREIRSLSASGMSWEEIAAKFGIVRETVRRVAQGETWHGRRRHSG